MKTQIKQLVMKTVTRQLLSNNSIFSSTFFIYFLFIFCDENHLSCSYLKLVLIYNCRKATHTCVFRPGDVPFFYNTSGTSYFS